MALQVHIKKKLDQFVLNMSFTVKSGCLGILGASGSGKSMTLKCIAGIETPDEGYISLDDKVLFDSKNHINLKPQEREIGYLFQNYALFPNMTVEQNLTAAQTARRNKDNTRYINRIDSNTNSDNSNHMKKIEDILHMFDLTELKEQYPDHLSGGEQQRVALARMLLSKPKMILFDEPFSAIDSFLRERLQSKLSQTLHDFDGISILVTHSRDEVYKLSDELMIIDNGHKVAYEATKTLFASPQDLMTARLTGCKNIAPVEMNVAIDSETAFHVPEWGLRFSMKADVLQKKQLLGITSHIGIRAHDFMTNLPLSEDTIRLEVIITEIQEAPFEWNAMFTIKDMKSTKKLWWKVSKEQIRTYKEMMNIHTLYVDIERIMLLKWNNTEEKRN